MQQSISSCLFSGLKFLLSLSAFFAFAPLSAQVTTSGLDGRVMTGTELAIGATITLTHEPTGNVRHAVTNEEGEPIVGAVVVATGTTNGGVTDADGNFTIQVPSQTASISISYIGC